MVGILCYYPVGGVVVHMHVRIRASPRNYYSSSFRRIYFVKPFPRPLLVVSYYLMETPAYVFLVGC